MKLKGEYKNRSKRKPPLPSPVVIFECPGCGWRSQPARPETGEMEYVLHLNNVHHGLLECAFCEHNPGNGIRFLPCFATLASHVHTFHKERCAGTDADAIPPHAFK
jgi:hypothetical protein